MAEMRAGMVEMRAAMQQQGEEFRAGMAEMRAGMVEMRAAMQQQGEEFRADMAEIRATLREQAETNRQLAITTQQQVETVDRLSRIVETLIQQRV
jgi:methyl-accepting chemotaxis protein